MFYGSIANLLCDILVAVLPIPIIVQLDLPMKRRLGLIALFGLAFVVIFAGSVRIYFVWQALFLSYDETWYTYGLWISSVVELDLGVVSKTPAFTLGSPRLIRL